MKTGPIRCLLVLLLWCCVSPNVSSSHAAPGNLHTLWKVEGKHSAVYLLGSIHVLKDGNYPLPGELEAAFTNSSIVAFEADIEAMEVPETQMKILARARLPEGQTLDQQLSAGVYANFTNHLKELGLPVAVLDQFKPSMAAITLVMLELRRLGFDPQYGLDRHFSGRARKAGKQIVALETLDFQVGLVTDFTREEGELVMKSTLEDLDKLKKEFPALLKAWQTGDADGLANMLNEVSEKVPAIFKRLVTDRNKQWLPKVEEWLRGDKNAVMIVGAGHLVGKEGVVELLRKKGYKVTQQ
jgi:uncharacterized protein YbaP (TraB family)